MDTTDIKHFNVYLDSVHVNTVYYFFRHSRQHLLLQDLLHTVFQNGRIVKTYTFDEIRDNAKLTNSELKDLLL